MAVFALLLVTFIFFLFFANRGLSVHDEGYILDAAHRFFQGQVPYRDFWIIYPPGIVYLLGGLFWLFGPNILLGRFLMVLVGLAISYLLYKVSRSLTPSLLFLAWGIPHLNFPWPAWFSLLFMLASLASVKSPRLSGLFAGVGLLFKQTLGIAIVIAALISTSNRFKLIQGLILPILATVLVLASQGALDEFVHITLIRTLEYQAQGLMRTDWPEFNLINLPKAFFYYFPFILLGFYAFKLLRHQLSRHQIIVFIYVSLFFLAGYRPTTDILHVALIYPALFPLIKPKWILLIIPLFILGLAKLYLKPYAGFEAAYPQQIYKAGSLLVDDRALHLFQVTQYINRRLKPGEPIFVYFYAPMIYFISGHSNATRFPMAQTGVLNQVETQELIQDLNTVNLVVLQSRADTVVYDTLMTEFAFDRQFGDYQVRVRL